MAVDGHAGTVLFEGRLSAHGLTAVRRDLAAWARKAELDNETTEAITLCGYEALANALEHAYRERGQGPVQLHATRIDEVVTITVRDRGRWRTPRPDRGLRGRGLMLIRRLGNHTDVNGTPHGTTVRMTWLVGDRHPS